MKIMLIAFAAIIVIAVAADVALQNIGYSSAEQAAGNAVRIEQAIN